jgi:hypothetical protein
MNVENLKWQTPDVQRPDAHISTARHFLNAAVMDQLRSPEYTKKCAVFENLSTDASAGKIFDALEKGGMKEIYRYGFNKIGQVDSHGELKRRIAFATLDSLGDGLLTQYRKDGEVVISPSQTVGLSRKFTEDKEGVQRPHGLLVERDGPITVVASYILFPTPKMVDGVVSGLREHVRRFGDLSVEDPDLVLITPKPKGDLFIADSAVDHFILPMTDEDIRAFADYVMNDYRPKPGSPTLQKAWEMKPIAR